MPEFYTWAIYLINQFDEIGEKQLKVFGSRGDQICSSIHLALWFSYVLLYGNFKCPTLEIQRVLQFRSCTFCTKNAISFKSYLICPMDPLILTIS